MLCYQILTFFINFVFIFSERTKIHFLKFISMCDVQQSRFATALHPQNGQDENLFRLAYQHLQLAEYSFDKDSDGLQGDMTVTRSSSESVPGQMLDCVLMKRKSGKKCAFPC